MTPCARCGQPSSSDLWGMASCDDCRAVWFASERTTSRPRAKAVDPLPKKRWFAPGSAALP